MTYILRDCVEHNCIYCILHFIEDNVNRVDIDNTINDIKNRLDVDIVNDLVRAVLEELSTIYTFVVYEYDGDLEI